MTLPHLGHRAILRYNRFAHDLAAFNYVLRVAKPGGTVGETTLTTLNQLIHTAQKLFGRHPDLPFVPILDPANDKLTVADAAILVARLTVAAIHFEERYSHLQANADRPRATSGADGLPSPHR